MSDIKELIQKKYNNSPFSGNGSVQALIQQGLQVLDQEGSPTVKHEEWKYTRIAGVLNKEYHYAVQESAIAANELDALRLPGYEQANELVFINGIYHAELSTIRSSKDDLVVLPISEAVKGSYKSVIDQHLGHSSNYHQDGINAMNNAFAHEGLFIAVNKNVQLTHPVYC
ncbi:MAG: Fe-S cluster assembly protein SufD, partial [Bacteroidota bacterium]